MIDKQRLLELLGSLESLEDPLLSWGVVDGGISEGELHDHIREWGMRNAPFDAVEDLVVELVNHGFIFRDDTADPPRWRTRIAETLRLLARLRQIFPTRTDAGSAWRKGTSLVADFRYLRRPRSYPLRNVTSDSILEGIDVRSDVLEEALRSLTSNGSQQLMLSGFQVRATRQVLASLETSRSSGTVVGAGTGSGKTLAFYLPAYAYLASLQDSSAWTRAVAIYPRTELLRDQFTSAFQNARAADDLFRAHTGRKLRIGAFYGAAPRNFKSLDDRYSQWRKTTHGYRCPYLGCPGVDASGCGGELYWPFEAVKQHEELLVCESCGAQFGEDTIVITRDRMKTQAPDIVFSTTEMLNKTLPDRSMCSILGLGVPESVRPRLMLLDEIHTYGGATGAQTAMVLRRWRHRVGSPVAFVGLSATLVDASNYFADLIGLDADSVTTVEPEPDELTYEGAEYMVAVRSDPTSGASVLSATIQSAMLVPRILDTLDRKISEGAFGTKTFVFTDDLDVTNRLYYDLTDAEGLRFGNFGRASTASKAPLASLRNPALGGGIPRRIAGQSWDLPALLGHPIDENGRLRLGRTSSQDTGVDRNAQLTVATASLEVGFDDPEVGAVIQHKAPRDVAQFVQRKGRAGRPRGMRPITLIILSDYGRDRATYEAWDTLFDPVLPRRTLPIHNRAVLRMHATQSLLEWIAVKIPTFPNSNLWQALKEAPSGPYAEWNISLHKAIADMLEKLLIDPNLQNDLARWIQRSLYLSPTEVDEILWHPPRPVLIGAVPTLIRRLRSRFAVANPSGTAENTDSISDHPLPEYFPSTLFGDLTLSEVNVVVPSQTRQPTDVTVELMGIDQMLREYAPGRASRRFATRNSEDRHWIPIPVDSQESTVDVEGFIPDFDVAATPLVTHRGRTTSLALVRPHSLTLSKVPPDIRDSSNARLSWCSQFVEQGTGVSVNFPSTDRMGSMIREATFFLHARSDWVRVHRLAVESDATIQYEDGTEKRSRVQFSSAGQSAGIGATFDVDALRFRVDLPTIPATAQDHDLGIASAWFMHVITTDETLLQHGNTFQLRSLHQALETMLILEAVEKQVTLEDAYSLIGDSVVTRLGKTLQALFQRPGLVVDDTDPDANPSRLLQRLTALVTIPAVAVRIDALVPELWRPNRTAQDAWIRTRLLTTVGQAAFAAARQLCPDHDPDGLYVDTEPGLRSDGLPRTCEVWLSEPNIGGGGFLEALANRIQAEPRRFLRLTWSAIQPAPAERIDRQLRAITDRLTSEPTLIDVVANYRSCHTQTQRIAALANVRKAIGRPAIHGDEHMLIANFANRILRPGTSTGTDQTVHELVTTWADAEDRLGLEISARTWAFLASIEQTHDAALNISGSDIDARQRRLDAMLSLLWPTGWQLRSEALKTWNPFADLADPLPELLREIVPEGSRIVPIGSSAVVEQIREILAEDDQVRVSGSDLDIATMSDLIVELTTHPVESEWLYVHPRVVEVTTTQTGDTLITLETSEGAR
ncbi:protein DpdJ [Gordonia sp. CPCC 205515]|uniref:protein DpdJ n=1 Tax=Gordonia sp. CPCC 205515 TaxID=3140791 RepID=UPI003AF38CC6